MKIKKHISWGTKPIIASSLILMSTLPLMAQSTPSESVHSFCQRYAEDYANRHRGEGALEGAARGATGGALFGAILGDTGGGALAGAGLGAVGGGIRQSQSRQALVRQAYDRCIRERQ
ncbi:hypothetical protein PCC7418_1280 [Halothece sp. PCC 7418]|nr:hypothetical protein PCC7418_1280 [Halothece sp. PCC 7418]